MDMGFVHRSTNEIEAVMQSKSMLSSSKQMPSTRRRGLSISTDVVPASFDGHARTRPRSRDLAMVQGRPTATSPKWRPAQWGVTRRQPCRRWHQVGGPSLSRGAYSMNDRSNPLISQATGLTASPRLRNRSRSHQPAPVKQLAPSSPPRPS